MIKRRALTGVLCVLALGAACRKREEVRVAVDDAGDIPREVALRRLRELVPTADSVACTAPKESYKSAEVKVWDVGPDALRVVPLREKDPTFAVKYADLTQVRLDRIGRSFQVRLFAPAHADAGKDYLSFVWRAEEPAKQVVELLEALRLKK
jgi:hypothetical protein